MLINYVPGEESRIAIVRDGRLEEFYQERASAESHVGNIYQGKVLNVEPSIQAAFIDFGLERNGFLHVSDLHPKYFPGKDREEFEQVGSKTPHRERPPIQRCLRRGDKVLVQVLKEGIGTKGPTLTSYLSIPGRFLVMMPDMQRTGVSRKVDDDDARREMRKILQELNPPDDFGFIVRTAGIGQTKAELKRDLSYLARLWKNIDRRKKKLKGPGELYTESDLVIRTIRDIFSSEIDRVLVDDPTAAKRAYDFLSIASPRSRSKVVYYAGPVPLYHWFDIESQIESIHSRTVLLPSGGSLVIDQTEALVAIDVNSGKSRDARDAESNAYNTDKEATDEICRQLRLRDLGGVVVCDLIDMRDAKHRRAIEQKFRENLKRDRARTRIGSISQFGILEMTRQRMRPSLKNTIYTHCSSCAGTGHVKTPESVVLDVMRRLALALHHKAVDRIELTISPDVAFHLLNRKRQELVVLERQTEKEVMVRVGGGTIDYVHISAFDARGGAVEPDSLGRLERDGETPETFVELTSSTSEKDLLDEEEAHEQAAVKQVEAVEEGPQEPAKPAPPAPDQEASDEGDEEASQDGEEGGGKRRRRRRRRGGRRRRKSQQSDEGHSSEETASGEPPRDSEPQEAQAAQQKDEQNQPKAEADEKDGRGEESQQSEGSDGRRRGRSRGRGRKSQKQESDQPQEQEQGQPEKQETTANETGDSGEDSGGGRRRRRRRRGGRGGKKKQSTTSDENGNTGEASSGGEDSPSPPRQAPPEDVSSGYSNRVVDLDGAGEGS